MQTFTNTHNIQAFNFLEKKVIFEIGKSYDVKWTNQDKTYAKQTVSKPNCKIEPITHEVIEGEEFCSQEDAMAKVFNDCLNDFKTLKKECGVVFVNGKLFHVAVSNTNKQTNPNPEDKLDKIEIAEESIQSLKEEKQSIISAIDIKENNKDFDSPEYKELLQALSKINNEIKTARDSIKIITQKA